MLKYPTFMRKEMTACLVLISFPLLAAPVRAGAHPGRRRPQLRHLDAGFSRQSKGPSIMRSTGGLRIPVRRATVIRSPIAPASRARSAKGFIRTPTSSRTRPIGPGERRQARRQSVALRGHAARRPQFLQMGLLRRRSRRQTILLRDDAGARRASRGRGQSASMRWPCTFPNPSARPTYNTPWYMGPAALDRMEELLRRHPELKMRLDRRGNSDPGAL